jgi:nucleotidyltransferase substrate binding protein (TIGR01987 family)
MRPSSASSSRSSLAWKATKRLAREQGIEAVSPRQAFKEAFKLGWIADDRKWLDMLEDRNRTSHTYKEQVAEEIYGRLSSYAASLAGLLEKLKAVNSANP